eukprot:jgi/Ulvmu1/10603/UM065_0059.1
MMNALRMVWIISRHYSDDERMGDLFRRIASMLAFRVEEHIDLKHIFDIPATDALGLINTAALVLSEWRDTYMKVREHIEVSGQHARWEFPKNMLFERTGHIGEILSELKFMVETVHDFFKFLGPEFKAVTGDAEEIDNVISAVMAMAQRIKDIDFNIFNRELSLDWHNCVNVFKESNEHAKDATRSLIDTSFRRLRSAEGAFELLQNFKKIESKGAIKEQMANKLNDILEQVTREIEAIAALFEEQRYLGQIPQFVLQITSSLLA